jgi:hypothetical protein
MVKAIQAYAKSNGYAVTIQRSSNRDGTVYLGCDRGGQYRARYSITNTTRLRNTGTRLNVAYQRAVNISELPLFRDPTTSELN